MRDDSYTIEDYFKDFEFDYLGFDGIPEGHVPGHASEEAAENGPEQEADDSGKNDPAPRPLPQK